MTENLIERHPLEAVRLVALEWLGDATAARGRLADESDAEALHDFRVAIRRLRSTEKAFRDELSGSVSKKDRRRLRRVADATNAGRDAEVQIAWVESQRQSLYSKHRPGAQWFRDRLRTRKGDADRRLHAEIAGDFDRVCESLRASLPTYTRSLTVGDASPSPRFADALAARVRAAAADLAARLGVVTGAAAVEEAHQARISAKRLRYLLEPVGGEAAGAKEVVRSSKALQDALGELHDLDIASAELADALRDLDGEQTPVADGGEPGAPTDGADAPPSDAEVVPPPAPNATGDRDPRPGIVSLARRARTRRDTVYGEVAVRWFAGAAAAFFARVERVAQTLATSTAPPEVPCEIERKYLLRAFPPRARESAPLHVEQGWIPGDTLRERVRRVRDANGERFYRTVKVGSGLSRIELEESTTTRVWDALWPLTADRRIAKRRYAVPAGDHTWEIDEFEGRDLVLAEIELPDEQTAVDIPEWLADFVVRDVTDEPGFTNYELAEASSDE